MTKLVIEFPLGQVSMDDMVRWFSDIHVGTVLVRKDGGRWQKKPEPVQVLETNEKVLKGSTSNMSLTEDRDTFFVQNIEYDEKQNKVILTLGKDKASYPNVEYRSLTEATEKKLEEMYFTLPVKIPTVYRGKIDPEHAKPLLFRMLIGVKGYAEVYHVGNTDFERLNRKEARRKKDAEAEKYASNQAKKKVQTAIDSKKELTAESDLISFPEMLGRVVIGENRMEGSSDNAVNSGNTVNTVFLCRETIRDFVDSLSLNEDFRTAFFTPLRLWKRMDEKQAVAALEHLLEELIFAVCLGQLAVRNCNNAEPTGHRAMAEWFAELTLDDTRRELLEQIRKVTGTESKVIPKIPDLAGLDRKNYREYCERMYEAVGE